MGLQLPGELTELLSMIGYDWPESDEQKIFELAGEWTGMADKINSSVADLESAARTIIGTTPAPTSTPSPVNGPTTSRRRRTSWTPPNPPT